MTDARARIELLQVEPTTRCNFTCGFCCGRSMAQGDMTLATFEAALARFPNLRHLELQGEGEPLLNPAFFDIAFAAKERGLRLSVITNGSLLGPEAVERVLAVPLDQVLVSIESPDAAAFEEIRGGRLDKVLRNVGRLAGRKRRRGLRRPVVGFAVTVLRRTLGDLDAIVSLYHQLGLDGGITVQMLQRMDAYRAVYDDRMEAELVSAEEAHRYREQLARYDDLVREGQRRGFHGELFADWSPRDRTCPWLERGALVTHDGALMACAFMKDSKRLAVGRVVGEDGPELWAKHEELRRELKSGRIPSACRGCPVPEAITHATATPLGVRDLLSTAKKRLRAHLRRSPAAPLLERAAELEERVRKLT